MTVAEAAFHQLVAGLDYPMFIVTADVEGTPAGCLVGFTTQCSIQPARFIVFLSKKNHTYRTARAAEFLGVHVLGPDAFALAELFGHRSGDRGDKFASCSWHSGPRGVPIIEGSGGWFVGQVLAHVDGGDHLGFLLEPVEAGKPDQPVGLGFQDVKGIEPGHEP